MMVNVTFRFVTVLGAVCMLGPVAFAQPRMNPEERLDQLMEEATEVVGLSVEQAAAIRPLLAAEFEKQREAFMTARNSGAGLTGVREEMQIIRTATDEKVATLLSEDQIENWSQWREEVAERRRGSVRGSG